MAKIMVLAMPALFSHQPGHRLKIWDHRLFPARLPRRDRAMTAEGDRCSRSEIAVEGTIGRSVGGSMGGAIAA